MMAQLTDGFVMAICALIVHEVRAICSVRDIIRTITHAQAATPVFPSTWRLVCHV